MQNMIRFGKLFCILLDYLCPLYLLAIYPHFRAVFSSSLMHGEHTFLTPYFLVQLSAVGVVAFSMYRTFVSNRTSPARLTAMLCETVILLAVPFTLRTGYFHALVYKDMEPDMFIWIGLELLTIYILGLVYNTSDSRRTHRT